MLFIENNDCRFDQREETLGHPSVIPAACHADLSRRNFFVKLEALSEGGLVTA